MAPVPTAATHASIWPPVWAQISAAVVAVGGNAFERVELVDVERAALAGDGSSPLRGGVDVAPGDAPGRPFDLRHEHDLGAETSKHGRPCRAVAVRHRDDERVAERGAHDGQPRAHVAARHLDDGRARRQAPVVAGGAQDGERRAVLDASTWLHELGLREDASGSRMRAVKRDQGRAADEFERRGADGHRLRRWGLRGRSAQAHELEATRAYGAP